MRINKKIVLLATAIVIASGAAATYAIVQDKDTGHSSRDGAAAQNAASKDNSKTQAPTEVTSNDEGQKVSPDGTTPVGQEQTSPAPQPPSNQSITITNLSQNDDTVVVRVQTVGVTSGTCQLNLTQGNHHNIVKTANIVLVATSYTCEGFDIPKSEFEHDGEWGVQVGLQGSSVTSEKQTINVQK